MVNEKSQIHEGKNKGPNFKGEVFVMAYIDKNVNTVIFRTEMTKTSPCHQCLD